MIFMWNLPAINIGYQFHKMYIYYGPKQIFLQVKCSLQAASLWALCATLWRPRAELEIPGTVEAQGGDGMRQEQRSGKVSWRWQMRWKLKNRLGESEFEWRPFQVAE